MPQLTSSEPTNRFNCGCCRVWHRWFGFGESGDTIPTFRHLGALLSGSFGNLRSLLEVQRNTGGMHIRHHGIPEVLVHFFTLCNTLGIIQSWRTSIKVCRDRCKLCTILGQLTIQMGTVVELHFGHSYAVGGAPQCTSKSCAKLGQSLGPTVVPSWDCGKIYPMAILFKRLNAYWLFPCVTGKLPGMCSVTIQGWASQSQKEVRSDPEQLVE